MRAPREGGGLLKGPRSLGASLSPFPYSRCCRGKLRQDGSQAVPPPHRRHPRASHPAGPEGWGGQWGGSWCGNTCARSLVASAHPHVPCAPPGDRGTHARRAGCPPRCCCASVSFTCPAGQGGTPGRARAARPGHPRPAVATSPSPAHWACRPRRGPAAGMCSAQRNVPNHSQMCVTARPPPPPWPTRVAGGHWGPRDTPQGQTCPRPDPAWPQGPAPACATASGCRGLRGTSSRAGRTPGCQGVNRRCHRGRAVSPCPRPAEAPQPSAGVGPGAGPAGLCGVLPRTPGPGAQQERSRAERGCQMESGCRQ